MEEAIAAIEGLDMKVISLWLILASCNYPSMTKAVSTGDFVDKTSQDADTARINGIVRTGDKLLKEKKLVKVFVEVEGKKNLIEIKDFSKWPDNITNTYNLVMSEESNPLLLKIIPYSESGDWNIECDYFFDSTGSTVALRIKGSFFDSECSNGVLREKLLRYYDADFDEVYITYSLEDDKGRSFNKEKCGFNYNFKEFRKYSETPVFGL